MADRYCHTGKQVMRNNKHFADAVDVEAAIRIAALLNRAEDDPAPVDEQELIDIVSDAMSDVHDMDTGVTDFARAGVQALRKEGLL